MNFKTILEETTEKYSIWIGQDARNKDHVCEVHLKIEGGIKHLVHRYEILTKNECIENTEKYGFFSKRPYILGQPCDGSIGSPVMALYLRFCNDRDIDPASLHKNAYPKETLDNINETITLAEWQGVSYPDKWGPSEIEGLIKSLHAINNHSLASEIHELMTSELLNDNNNYLLTNLEKETCERSYPGQEIPETRKTKTLTKPIGTSGDFETIITTIHKLYNIDMGYITHKIWNKCSNRLYNLIIIETLDGKEASHEQIESWKIGKMRLNTAEYRITVEKIP